MAQDYTATNPQTGEKVRWDGKGWVPVTGTVLGTAKSFGAGLVDVPRSLPQFAEAGNKESVLASWPEKQFEEQNEYLIRAREALKQKDFVAWLGHSINAALAPTMIPQTVEGLVNTSKRDPARASGQILGMTLLGKAGETPSALGEAGELARKPVQGLFDVGENFAERARAEHEANLAKLNEEYEQHVQEVGKRTAEDDAAYRTKVEQAKDEYARKIAENDRKRVEISAKQAGAETKRKALTTQPRSGPVYQRMAGMADQIATEDVPKLDQDVRAAQNSRWSAFRLAVGDRQVDWTPVQRAVVDAETNILQGSPENIAIFRNILREGVDPTIERATIFRRTAGSLEDVLSSRNMDEVTRARILKQLADEGAFEPRAGSGPSPAESVEIPFDDARGYYTELNQKIYRSRTLPGDVRRALTSVRDAVEGQVRATVPKEQLPVYNKLKADWSQYLSDFHDADGPLSQLKDAATSDGRLNLLTGSKGANIIEALGRYSRWNPKVTGMTGRLRSLMKQIRTFPSTAPAIPGEVRAPKFPEAPKPRELPTPPVNEPLDITQARLKALERMPQTWGQLRPYQAVIPWYWPRLAAQKAIAELLSHPEIRKWIAGAR